MRRSSAGRRITRLKVNVNAPVTRSRASNNRGSFNSPKNARSKRKSAAKKTSRRQKSVTSPGRKLRTRNQSGKTRAEYNSPLRKPRQRRKSNPASSNSNARVTRSSRVARTTQVSDPSSPIASAVRRSQKNKKNKRPTARADPRTVRRVPDPEPEPEPQPEQAEEFVEIDEFDPYLFIKSLPPIPMAYRNRRPVLPRKAPGSPPITIVLDLDETLVHCSVQPIPDAQLTFSVDFNGTGYEVYVRTRPFMDEFLNQVSEWFEVVLFTASQAVYADKLLNIIDKQKRIKYRVFRDSCVCVEGNFLKDLTVLGRDMRKCFIIDNTIQAFAYQLNNGIPIESWYDDPNDRELYKLLPYLNLLRKRQDVRPLIRDTFGIQQHVDSLPAPVYF